MSIIKNLMAVLILLGAFFSTHSRFLLGKAAEAAPSEKSSGGKGSKDRGGGGDTRGGASCR